MNQGLEQADSDWSISLPRAVCPVREGQLVQVQWFHFLTSDAFSFFAVGRPIPVPQTLHPSPEQIEELHQTYMEELRKLFEAHKRKYGISEHETLIFR